MRRNAVRALAAAVLMATASQTMAQTPMPVELHAVPGDTSVGSVVAFELVVTGDPIAIQVFDVAVEYDPAILQPIDNPWSLGPIGWGPVSTMANGPAGAGGLANWTEFSPVNMGISPTASGVYATLRFQVVGYGACALRLVSDDGSTPDGTASFYTNFWYEDANFDFLPMPLTVSDAAFDNSSLAPPPPPLPSPSPDPGGDGGGGGAGCRAGTAPGNLAPLLLVLAALTLYRTLAR